MSGPTNIQVGVAHIDQDTAEAVREMCKQQGCTCGDRLKVTVTTLTPEAAADLEAAGAPSGAKHSAVDVAHAMECPLLARAQGPN